MKLNIKKYENRKLYNKNIGGYVTINQIESLIKTNNNVQLQVSQHNTNEDLTREVIASIIARQVLSSEQDNDFFIDIIKGGF